MKTIEELIEKRRLINEQLNKADEEGSIFKCISLGNQLNVIDDKLRKMGVDVYHLD